MESSLTISNPTSKTEHDMIYSQYLYSYSQVTKSEKKLIVTPKTINYTFKTNTKVPKLGVMLVGLGGNNGTTFTGGIIANRDKVTWMTKKGENHANFFGSITQCSTTKIGVCGTEEIYVPFKDILPLVNPSDIVISGWDISKMNLADGMKRAEVFDYNLQEKLNSEMKKIVPYPGIYYPDFIAKNQKDRADNILPGENKGEHLKILRGHIKEFKALNKLDKVIVFWTANTERCSDIMKGINDTAENLLKAIEKSEKEISSSSMYAVAAILEGCSFINASPQNTLVPGIVELAEKHKVFICGDDMKTGQTKFKTAFTEFLVSAGIKPVSIVSYNHLGNNDGKNLSEYAQFHSKETSKASCVDDILASNRILFPKEPKIDHVVVIKYVPSSGDTKKALDEYASEIMMGGQHFLSVYNVCEDSLLAAPIMLDLMLLTEIFERIEWKTEGMKEFERFPNVLTNLGYLFKAPFTPKDVPLVNSLSRQKQGLENIMKICAGITLDNNTLLEFKCKPKT